MNKRLFTLLLLCATTLILGACESLNSFGTVPDVSQIQNEPFYTELLVTVEMVKIPVIVVALLSLVLGWKVGRFGLAINAFVISGILLYTYLGGVDFVSDENFRLGFAIAGAVLSGLLAYFLYNLMAIIIGGVIGSMLLNGAWLQVADRVPPQILVFVSTFISALVMFLVFRLFMVAFSAISGAVILMIAIPFGTFWVIPVAAAGIVIQMVIAFLIKDDIFQNMKGDFRAALGQAFGDILGPFGVLFEHQKESKEAKQASKETKLAPEPRAAAPQAQAKTDARRNPVAPKQQPYQAPQQPYQAPKQQPYQAPQQPYQAPQQPYQAPQQPYQAPQQPYQAPQQPYQAPQQPYQAPATELNMQRASLFRPENYYIEVSTGQTFPLVGSEITVGRNADNVIVLNDLKVSSYHLMLSIQTDGVIAWDNHSTNGTLFNGNPLVGSVRLSTIDIIQVGDLTLRLRQAADI